MESEKPVERLTVNGYRSNVKLTVLMWFLILLTGGTFGIALLWSERMRLWFKEKTSLSNATLVEVFIGDKKKPLVLPVHTFGNLRYFELYCRRYTFTGLSFELQVTVPPTHEEILKSEGRTSAQASALVVREGSNLIDIPLTPLLDDITIALLSPVNIYQYFCCILWTVHDYAVFASLLAVFIILSGIYEIYDRRKTRRQMRESAIYRVDIDVRRDGEWKAISSEELVPGDLIRLPDQNIMLPCDMVLVSGNAIVDETSLTGEVVPAVKVPPLSSQTKYNPISDRRHTLYGGSVLLGTTHSVVHENKTPGGTPVTTPLQTPEKKPAERKTPGYFTPGALATLVTPATPYTPSNFTEVQINSPMITKSPTRIARGSTSSATAVVTKIGFNTVKGELFRNIIFFQPMKYEYEREARKLLALLAVVGVALCSYVLYMFYGPNSVNPDAKKSTYSILYGLEIITILVPAELPLVFHVGLLFSSRFLSESNVSAADVSRIPISGTVDVMCFDKTGTLTKPDLEVHGVCPVLKGTGNFKFGEFTRVLPSIDRELFRALGVCHELAEISESLVFESQDISTQYVGPVLDQKLFASTGLVYRNAASSSTFPYVYGRGLEVESQSQVNLNDTIESEPGRLEILRRFAFDHGLQRMSVIVRDTTTGTIGVFTKGSPEAVGACCNPQQLPRNWQKEVSNYSKNGSYVIGLAYRERRDITLDNFTTIAREKVEAAMTPLGLALLHNQLKPETTSAIAAIKEGSIIPIVITGDNVYTAVHVSRQCGIISDAEVFVGEISSEKKSLASSNSASSSSFSDSRGQVVFRHFDDDHCFLDARSGKLTWDSAKQKLLDNEQSKTRIQQQSDGYYCNKESIVYALTAAAFEEFYAQKNSEFGHKFLTEKVVVFARMKPLQKEKVINMFKETKKIIGMCGDGANDCAAISSSHVGIALSKTEASVVSPFSAPTGSLSGVVSLVSEGRACITNSFGAFKFIVLYSVIQTMQALMAYRVSSDLSSGQYLLSDFLYCLPISFWIVRGLATKTLSRTKPTSHVIGFATIASLILLIVVSFVALVVPLILYQIYPANTPTTIPLISGPSVGGSAPTILLENSENVIAGNITSDDDDDDITDPRTTQTTILFYTGSMLYIFLGIVVSYGSDWRQPIYKHFGLILTSIGIMFATLFLMFMPISWDFLGFWDWCEFVQIGFPTKIAIVLVTVVAFTFYTIGEKLIVGAHAWMQDKNNKKV